MTAKQFEIKITFPKLMDSKRAKHELQRAVYDATILFFEHIGEHGRLTDGKKLYGNGHHMAQDTAANAGKLWNERLTEK